MNNSLESLYRNLLNYEYISFDIFDTLIKRNVNKPEDVFRVVERIYNGKGSGTLRGFSEERKEAERQARSKSIYKEITLAEIYENLSYSTETRNDLQTIEMRAEQMLCTANEPIVQIYDSLQKQNKIIYLVSDMYLPEDTIVAILCKCGITGYRRLYLSSTYRCRKRDGLFEEFINREGLTGKEIAHVGDDLYADCISARMRGYRTIFPYKIFRDGKKSAYKTADKKQYTLATDIVDSYISNHLNKEDDQYYKIGLAVYGPLLYAFVKWIEQKLVQEKRTKVLFLARDSYIIQKAFHLVSHWSGEDHYFFISRNSVFGELLENDYSTERILEVLPRRNISTLHIMLKRMNADNEDSVRLAYAMGLDLDEEISLKGGLTKQQKTYFDKITQIYQTKWKKDKDLFGKYVLQFIKPGDRIAVIDIGWKGTMQKAIESARMSAGVSADVKGYYLGLEKQTYQCKLAMEDFLSSKCDNEIDPIWLRAARGLIEVFFTAPHGMTIGYDEKHGELHPILDSQVFLKQTKNNDLGSALEKLQFGALAFAEQFNSISAELGVELTPTEAMRPIFRLCAHPRMEDLEALGDIEFQEGKTAKLAHPDTWLNYLRHSHQLKSDLYASCWKAGFIRRLLHGAPFSYYFVYCAEKRFIKEAK